MSHPETDQPADEPVRAAELPDKVRAHAGESTASSALEVKLTIGELATATGVATSALRYWEDIGLLLAPDRISGHRRYPASAVDLVGTILLLQDVGFTLRELKVVLDARSGDYTEWRSLHERKLVELDEQIAQAQAARTAIAHALACKHEHGVFDCPSFTGIVAARLAGKSLNDAHTQVDA